jgi:hypothetical protein
MFAKRNDEALMTKDEGMTKPEIGKRLRQFVTQSFLRHSSFGIRHFAA